MPNILDNVKRILKESPNRNFIAKFWKSDGIGRGGTKRQMSEVYSAPDMESAARMLEDDAKNSKYYGKGIYYFGDVNNGDGTWRPAKPIDRLEELQGPSVGVFDRYERNKGLGDIIDQVDRLERKADERSFRRFNNFWDTYGEDGKRIPELQDKFHDSSRLHDYLKDLKDDFGGKKKKDNFTDYCFGNKLYSHDKSCGDYWYENVWRWFLPDDIDKMEMEIRMDPLMYVDHPSRIIRGFARSLIQ